MPQTVNSVVTLMEDHLAEVTGLPRSDVYKLLGGWTFIPYIYNHRICGTAIMSGTEVHFIMKPQWRVAAFKRQAARRFFEKLFAGKEFLTTRVLRFAVNDQKFVERLGFVETHRDEKVVYYMLTEIPFGRKDHAV